MQRLLLNLQLAIEGVFDNRLRAILTALGIVFGVAAVIAMLAIGSGAKQAIIDQMKLIGSNNIVIESEVIDEEEQGEEEKNKDKKNWSPGLTMQDAEILQRLIPSVDKVSPEVVLPMAAMYMGKRSITRCVGINNSFFELNNITLQSGSQFHPQQMESGAPVCIIGHNIQTRLFSGENAIGKSIKCGKSWMRVIGVLKRRDAGEEKLKNLGIRDYNDDVYVPIQTALLRFKNRGLISAEKLENNGNDDEISKNYHQLDRVVIQVKDAALLRSTRNIIARMLNRRHREVLDYQIQVPELIIEAQQKNQELFNIVLAAIAGISLLVGGIGIMNIMLASVLERIKEIGVRRSLGATREDIIQQFLLESIIISLGGGIIGIILGISTAHLIAQSADIPTIVTTWSVVLSFGVAATIGLVFGLFPARKAAKQDPIKALRTD